MLRLTLDLSRQTADRLAMLLAGGTVAVVVALLGYLAWAIAVGRAREGRW